MSKPSVSEACIACGTCEAICPAVFKVAEVEGKMIATVLEADYEAEKAKIDEAIGACPTQAISWQE
ncbi:MAG: ferredoxin [Candidatus Buchananbacteria bacterium]